MAGITDFLNIFQQVNSIVGINNSADMAEAGANLSAGSFRAAGVAAVQGGQYSAGVYRQAGQAAVIAANYNIALNRLEEGRKNAAISLQLSDVSSTNRSIQGASGFSMGSGSYLAVQRDGLARVQNQVRQMAVTMDQQRKQINYQGQLTNMNYENQARNAEYQGVVAQVNYENQARQAEYQGQVAKYNMQRSNSQNIGSAVGNIVGLQ